MSISAQIPRWLPHERGSAGLGAMLEAATAQSTTQPAPHAAAPHAAAPPAAPPATQAATLPEVEITVEFLAAGAGFMLLLSLAVTGIAWALGAFRSRPWPIRVLPGQPVWPLVAALGAGIMLLLSLVVVLTLTMGLGPGEAAEAVEPPSTADQLQAMQVSAISYAAAVIGALVVVGLFRRLGFRNRLGLGLGRLPSGLAAGGIAALLVMPWMWASGAILQMIRFWLGYPIDATHPILQAILDDPDPRIIAWGIISALVIAPVAEELLFRGLLQTSLVHGLPRIFGVVPDAEIAGEGPQGNGVPRAYRWVGIVLASIAFALLHPPWSVPLIFILALMLGYLYERTGNLWAPIAVHFVFNAVNVLFVLLRV